MIITEEMREMPEMIGNWMKKEVVPHLKEYEYGEFPMFLYDQMAELGLNAMCAPERFGGLGLSNLEASLIAEEIGKWDCGLGSGVGVNESAAHLINKFGTEEQQKHFYETILPNKWGAFCLTEPNAGSDASAVITTAKEDGDDYILNGTKCFSTNGGIAACYFVFATVDRALGLKGITCFMVERDRAGISIGKEEDKCGHRLSNTTEVVFTDVRVPKANIIGEVGKGFKIAMSTLDMTRLNVACMGVGLAQRALDEAIAYSKTRVQFGKPIANLQAIQFMIADMAIDIEAARQLNYHTAELQDAGLPFTKFSAMSKCRGSDVAMRVAVDALQILGGYGYMREYPMEKLMRDAKLLQIYEGTNQVQRSVVARESIGRY